MLRNYFVLRPQSAEGLMRSLSRMHASHGESVDLLIDHQIAKPFSGFEVRFTIYLCIYKLCELTVC